MNFDQEKEKLSLKKKSQRQRYNASIEEYNQYKIKDSKRISREITNITLDSYSMLTETVIYSSLLKIF